jgi:hypothetical protein
MSDGRKRLTIIVVRYVRLLILVQPAGTLTIFFIAPEGSFLSNRRRACRATHQTLYR